MRGPCATDERGGILVWREVKTGEVIAKQKTWYDEQSLLNLLFNPNGELADKLFLPGQLDHEEAGWIRWFKRRWPF
jgi:hypothetical protein